MCASCTIIVQASFLIELFAIELIRQVFGTTVLVYKEFSVWQVSIILRDVGFGSYVQHNPADQPLRMSRCVRKRC